MPADSTACEKVTSQAWSLKIYIDCKKLIDNLVSSLREAESLGEQGIITQAAFPNWQVTMPGVTQPIHLTNGTSLHGLPGWKSPVLERK